MITGTCAACGRPGHRYGTTHGPNAPDRWDPIACINGLRGEVEHMEEVASRLTAQNLRLEAANARLRRALDDVDGVLSSWRRRLDSGHTIDTTDVQGLRLHVLSADQPVRHTQ